MMDSVALGLSLLAISFMICWLLVIAWIEFGQQRHALTWAIAFGLFGIAFGLMLVSRLTLSSPMLGGVILAICAAGTGLICFAFRQRSGDLVSWKPILIAAAAQTILAIAILHRTGSFASAVLPYNLLNAAACWYAGQALVGRRKGERAAEQVALFWLRGLALLCLGLLGIGLIGIANHAGGDYLIRLVDLAPVLPAVLTGIGLFAIFLLTADLADQSRRLAGTDMLTGLLNRRGFEEAALALLGSARRNDRALCMTVVDIDHFKVVNDRYGHLAGDEVLRRFAGCLAAHAGPRDIVARIGGEEFALMLPDCDRETASARLESARGMVEQCPLDLPGDHRVTASFGLAYVDVADDMAGLFAKADRALYLAKSEGRNRVVIAE